MPTDVIIDPSTGQIYWNDSAVSAQSISIKGDAQNTISIVGYSGAFSPGSSPGGATTLATFTDNSGTDAFKILNLCIIFPLINNNIQKAN